MSSQRSIALKEKYEEAYCHEPFYTGGLIQWTDDGKHMACACDGAGVIIAVDTGQRIRKLVVEEDAVTSVLVSPNSRYVVTSHKSGLLRQWTFDGELIRTWKSLHVGPVSLLVFDSTSTLLATGGSDSTSKVWDIGKQYCTHNLRGCQGVFSVLAFHPQPNKAQLFGCADDLVIRAWDLVSSTVDLELKGHFSAVTAIDFAEDGRTLISCGRDKVVIVWDLDTGNVRRTIPAYESLEGVVLLPHGLPLLDVDDGPLYVMTAGAAGSLQVFNTETSKEVYSTKVAKQRITQLKEVAALRCIATVSEDDVISLRNLHDLTLHKQWVGHLGEVLDMALIGKDEEYLALATNGAWLCVYHLPTLSCQLVDGHSDTLLAITVWKADPCYFATASKDNSIRVWRIDDAGKIHCIGAGSATVSTVASSLTKLKFLVSGSKDTTLKRWSFPSQSDDSCSLKCSYTEVAHDSTINSVAVSPNDKIIATGSQDHTAKLWSSKHLRLLGVLRGHRRGIWCVRFSPVDQVLASASTDSTIRLWSISDFTCVKSLEGHGGSVVSAQFISRGMQLLSCGSDGLVKLWNIKSSECALTLDRHTDRLWALAVKEDEEEIFSGGADSRIIKWRNTTEIEKEKRAEEEDRMILQQQELSNLINDGRVAEALGIALSLRQPSTALSIVNDILIDGDGDTTVAKIISELKKEQKEKLVEYAVSWNTNSRNCFPAQVVIESLLKSHTPDELQSFTSLQKCVEGLLPYCERHMSRITLLAQASTFLDYTLSLMDLTHRGISENKREDFEENIADDVKPNKKKRKLASIELLEPEFEPLKVEENLVESDSDDSLRRRTVASNRKKSRSKRQFSTVNKL